MQPQATRASLLSRVRDPADDASWREFEAQYGELILRYALVRRLQHADAEDVRQIVLLKLSKTLRNFAYEPERGRFRDYLGRAVRNAIIELSARANRATAAVDSSVEAALAAESGDAEALWEHEWTSHHYRLAMRTLRATFEPRSVQIFDSLLAGEPVETLAAAHGMTAHAVHRVKQRIGERLKELIAAQVRAEDEVNEPPSAE